MLTRIHELKGLLMEVEKQEEKKGLLFAAVAPPVAVHGAACWVLVYKCEGKFHS